MHIVIGHNDMLSPGVITVPDDDPDSIYEDAPDEFSTSELTDRPQFRNERFKLDYSSILEKSNKTYGDDYEIETAETGSASTSKPAKVTIKKRPYPQILPKINVNDVKAVSLAYFNCQKVKMMKVIVYFFLCLFDYFMLINFDYLLCKLDEHSECSSDDNDGKTKSRDAKK